MKDDFGVRGRLTDRTVGNQLAAKRQAIREVAVMGDRDAADFEFGKERLDVAQRHLAGRRIARMPDGDIARQLGECRGVRVMISDETHALFRIELLAVGRNDTGCLLAAMLERVQAKRRQGCCVRMSENAENAAFFVEGVALEFVMDFAGSEIGHRISPLLRAGAHIVIRPPVFKRS